MGLLSLQMLAAETEKEIEEAQLEAREKIWEMVEKARRTDPLFFEIPDNPFNPEVESDSDYEDEEEKEHSDWMNNLKSSQGQTAKELLKIRKELYSKVHDAVDKYRRTARTGAITSLPPTSSIYCRLIQLEYIL